MSSVLAPQAPIGSFVRMPPQGTALVAASQLFQLVSGLGQQTRIDPQGLAHLNEPLIEAIVQYKTLAVPALQQFLAKETRSLAIIEGLYTAQRLAEAKVPNVRQLYSTTARWNYTHNPLIQIYLAGFYRKLNIPETFGPMLATMIHLATQHYPKENSLQVPLEELGGAILQQLAEQSAQQTLQRLMPSYVPSQPNDGSFAQRR